MRYSSTQSLRGYDKAAQGSITPTIAGYVVVSDPRLPHEMKESNDNSDSKLIVTYNVEDANEPTLLYSYYAEEGDEEYWTLGVDMFDKVEIDGVEVSVTDLDTASGTRQFDAGEHTVAYTLKNPTLIGFDPNDPEEIAFGALFGGCEHITGVMIPNSVTSIGNYAFNGCISLIGVTIGNGVTSIGNETFSGCISLTSITIPDSVISIGNWAFNTCSGLTSITVDSNNAVYDSRNDCNAIIETSTNTLIRGCGNTIIPNTVTSIGNSAFSNCNSLTNVTIPDSVTSIGSGAFNRCNSLTSIIIPNTVTNIDDWAFGQCSGLTSVTIGSGITSMGVNVFEECYSLTTVIIENGATTIGNGAFKFCTGLTSIIIPNSITNIDNHAFVNCSSLTSITIPNSVTTIGDWTFAQCSNLTSVTIGNGVTSIGNSAFQGCSGLASVTSNATTAPTIQNDTFRNVKTGGTLTVPIGSSGYDTWMQHVNYYLGLYNWTKVEQ